MRRHDLLDYNNIHCRRCRTPVALVQDYLHMAPAFVPGGIFGEAFNVVVLDDVDNHQHLDGNTLANTYCVQCRMLLGWKFIAVPQPSVYVTEGRFYMRLHKLSFWNDVPLLRLNEEQELAINEENADQDGGANEENADQDGDANEENADQDGNANEQVPNEQDLGVNEQNADQDGDANEQVPNEQDVGANEQNADQDGGGNEQNHDQDGGAPMN